MKTRLPIIVFSALLIGSPWLLQAEQDHEHDHEEQQSTARKLAQPPAHDAAHGEHDEREGHQEHAEHDHDEEHRGHDHDDDEHANADHDEHGHDDEGDDHGHGGHGDHEEESSVKLSAAQKQAAGIVVEPIRRRELADIVRAPGEVMLNAYRTSSVTPRVSAQVVERHARLGDVVSQGQPLVTLSSVDMAGAEGELIVAAREWQRVKKLGKKVVSAQRYTEARVAYQQARARVLAFGMTAQQVDKLIRSDDASLANGEFDLLAPQAGTVIKDAFIVGELIEPGRVLFVISDESVLWVEAKLTPAQVRMVSPGNAARIEVNGKTFRGKVVQVHHALDEGTRTLGVRIEVENPDDALHPGVFVQAQIASNDTRPALALPMAAVLRSADGDWVVFVENDHGEFEAKEVELLRTVGDTSVIDGIDEGTRVVTQGAFFVQSEIAKSGFEVHNH